MREAERVVVHGVCDHLIRFHPKSIEEAFIEFIFRDEFSVMDYYELEDFFMTWITFNWTQDEESDTLARSFLQEKEEELTSFQKEFITKASSSPYRFLVVKEVIPERRIKVYDILLKQEFIVKEQKATIYLEEGELVYARVLTMGDQSIFLGMGPIELEEISEEFLVDLQNDFPDGEVTEKKLLDSEDKLRYSYFFYVEQENGSSFDEEDFPIDFDEDGFPNNFFSINKMRYSTECSMQECLLIMEELLRPNKEKNIVDEDFDEDGVLDSVMFLWQGKEGNFIADIDVRENKIIISDFSIENLEMIQKEMQKMFGTKAKLFEVEARESSPREVAF